MSSNNTQLQSVFDVAQICSLKGIKNAILSPGSRCAPLTLGFVRNENITSKTISDERSAAFIGLGIAAATKNPVVLTCTSGSAAYNYSPAIAEAYYQQIPLIVITADRPPEWVDQLDGQTIKQENIYGQHVKSSYTFPTDLSHDDAKWHAHRLVSEAINKAQSFPMGPVHINVPLREPLYPQQNETLAFSTGIKIIEPTFSSSSISDEIWTALKKSWNQYHRKLIVGGQYATGNTLVKHLESISLTQKVPLVGDIISNLHGSDQTIGHSDLILGQTKNGLSKSLQPELLITFGKSVISKNLKLMLRSYKPKEHWHIQENGYVADTYQSLTKTIPCSPEYFFSQVKSFSNKPTFDNQKQENYYHIWHIEERKCLRTMKEFFPQEPLGEFETIKTVMQALPESCNLHLANSMAVRYANFVGLNTTQKNIGVYANRGTSGIDGSNSTAVGHSMASDLLNILITGDMAFFYDRNAFWHNYPYPNLRILLLNNHAGGIFRMIKGPESLPELEEYFETEQRLTALSIAKEFDFEYLKCNRRSKLTNYIKEFLELTGGPKILELESESKINRKTLSDFKDILSKTTK